MPTNSESFLSSKYGLKLSAIDAFADKVARPDHLNWWTNREVELKEWNDIILNATKTNRNYLAFIIGTYGRGKTLSLLKITEEAKNYPTVFSVFLNLKGEEKSAPGLDLLFRIFRNIDFKNLVKRIDPKELYKIIDSIPLDDFKKVLKAIYFGNINLEQSGLFSDLIQLQGNNTSEVATSFIKGYITPSATQLKNLGILRKIDKVDTAKEYLFGILLFLRKMGFTSFLIAIDEFEALFSLVAKAQQSIYIALLRSLYDFPVGLNVPQNDIANMVFFLGISESGWSSLRDIEGKEQSIGGPTVPLMERVDKRTVLTVFDRSQTLELIEKRLKFNRSDDTFENKPLIPFTEDFVDYIHQSTGGEPRLILVRTSHVLDAGIAEKVSRLDKKFAQKVLQERGLI